MKILHITTHLGGGVGKAHAALSAALTKYNVKQTFLLLEKPIDCRHVDAIRSTGAEVVLAMGDEHIIRLAQEADIVQFEFSTHPLLFKCLADVPFKKMRCVFWAHTSGLFTPVIQPGFVEQAMRFVFTSEISMGGKTLNFLNAKHLNKISSINSGFGFTRKLRVTQTDKPIIAYLGTASFVKMHDAFFDIVDKIDYNGEVLIWGELDSDVAACVAGMQHPDRIKFFGETPYPYEALSNCNVFFYPLQRHHFGTGENSLVEAMSIGLVPVVLNNPAELNIVEDRVTGLIADSIDACVALLNMLLPDVELRKKMSSNAVEAVHKTRTPELAASAFIKLWDEMLCEKAQFCDFRSVIGTTPASWYIAAHCLPGTVFKFRKEHVGKATKGSFAHYESVFAQDKSLAFLKM